MFKPEAGIAALTLRAQPKTRQPFAANRSAHNKPIPDDAPVTSTTRMGEILAMVIIHPCSHRREKHLAQEMSSILERINQISPLCFIARPSIPEKSP
jgi:hypothetical protein